MGAGRGHDQPVGGVAMKSGRQCIKRQNDLCVQRHHGHYVWTRRSTNPLRKLHRQFQTILGVKHLRFPKADRGKGDLAMGT